MWLCLIFVFLILSFFQLLAFNLSTNRFETIKTRPDPEFGLPLGRKCHALVQRDHLVYIIGGCRDAEFHPVGLFWIVFRLKWSISATTAQNPPDHQRCLAVQHGYLTVDADAHKHAQTSVLPRCHSHSCNFSQIFKKNSTKMVLKCLNNAFC